MTRLETWLYGHKSRSVSITHDDGYGASCWMVELSHEHGNTTGCEVAFIEHDADAAKADGIVVAMSQEDADWPGLEKTIDATLDAFEAGIWKAKGRVK